MASYLLRLTALTLILLVPVTAASEEKPQNDRQTCLWGGIGGAYFLAAPGELWIEVEKVNLHSSGRQTVLRAILAGPDRRVIEEKSLAGDGRCRFSTDVRRKGVYVLNVTVSNDRYGNRTAWGIQTNCPKYLVETSRSHRDAPHEEPLVLRNPDARGNVCFLPRQGRFKLDATGLPPNTAVEVFDAEGNQAGNPAADEDGSLSMKFDAGAADPDKPWRISLPRFQGVLNIDGVTRWTSQDHFRDLSLWTPQRDAWFPFCAYRWLLTPYNRLVYGNAGEEGELTFQVHNNGLEETAVLLDVEFDEGQAWPAELSAEKVVLPPGRTAEIALNYRVPLEGEQWTCYVRATPDACPEFTTWSSFELRKGSAPAEEPVSLPIVLTPYRHENLQFGYHPQYPLGNEFYFDLDNKPLTFAEDGFDIGRDGIWTGAEIEPGFSRASTKMAFDKDNWIYAIGRRDGKTALAYSADGGKTFKIAETGGNGACDIEQFSGHNNPQGPPPFVRYTLTERDPDRIWRRLNDIELFLPEKTAEGNVTIPPPVLISRKCIGYSGHSGMPSTVVSRGSKVHVIWAEATDPEEDVPGVPTFVATYDRADGSLSAPALIGYGPPANDCHNTPCITVDSKGCLHALIGTHGRSFKYARSLEPNNAEAGWTPAEDLGNGLRQTYIGMVCAPDDTLHVAFRLWHDDGKYFDTEIYGCLAHMSKKPGEPWSSPRTLVVPPFSSYSVYRQKLTIDRNGRLFLPYNCWTTYWFYRTDHRGERRAVLTSTDQGKNWKLVQSLDLQPSPN